MRVLNTVGMALVMAVPAALCQTTEQQRVLFAENFEQPDQTDALLAEEEHVPRSRSVSGDSSTRIAGGSPRVARPQGADGRGARPPAIRDWRTSSLTVDRPDRS